MAPLTMAVPVLGALVMGPVPAGRALGLALTGLGAHLFGFVINDIVDLEIDRASVLRSRSPLVSGRIGRRAALLYALFQIPLAIFAYLVIAGSPPGGLALIAASVALSLVYNLFSKRGPLPRLAAELALAASIALLAAAGSWAAAGAISAAAGLFAVTVGLVLLLVNSVPSGLKDLQTDQSSGARSFVLSAGCSAPAGGRLVISRFVRQYSLVLNVMIALGLGAMMLVMQTPWLAAGLAILLALFGALHLRLVLTLGSLDQLRRAGPLRNGYYNFLALAVLATASLPGLLRIVVALAAAAWLAGPWLAAIKIWRHGYRARLVTDSRPAGKRDLQTPRP